MDYAISHWRVPATRVFSLDLACSAWITSGGQCAVTRDLGLLNLCLFIELGGHIGQPINLRPLDEYPVRMLRQTVSALITGRGHGSDLVA